MLEVERALVNALSLAGVIPPHSAVAVAERCVPSLYDVAALSEAGRASGNPVEPLVRALREEIGGDDARPAPHRATSPGGLHSAPLIGPRAAARPPGGGRAAPAAPGARRA